MKVVMIVFALAAAAFAAPPPPGADQVAQTLRSEFNVQPEGAYVFSFETDNGIVRNENGEIREALDEENKPHRVVVVRGSYTYIDPEGNQQTINYFADETGYHAEGEAIPKVPVARR